jgi:hypothetical protein
MNAPLLLSYDVTTNFEDWLVSGRKKGEIVAEVSSHSLPFW